MDTNNPFYKKWGRGELAAILATCSPTMNRALRNFAAQDHPTDLNFTGVSSATLVALQSRGLVRLYEFGVTRCGQHTFTVARCF